jgi:D-xylose transport system permease protein
MSTDTLESGPSLKDAMSDYWSRIKSGDIGALPAVLGLVVLCGVFGFMSNVFLTSSNFANLITQAAAVTVIAMGLIFTLLLGEIDLSAGYASGVCGAILVILITKHGWAWFLALPVSIIVGCVLGFSIGTLVARLGIPSFVVTLAAFLGFQGLLLLLAGEGGTIQITDPAILAVENNNLSPAMSWGFYIVVSVLYVLSGLNRINSRRKVGLKAELLKLWILKTVGLLGVTGTAVFALNRERSNNPRASRLWSL